MADYSSLKSTASRFAHTVSSLQEAAFNLTCEENDKLLAVSQRAQEAVDVVRKDLKNSFVEVPGGKKLPAWEYSALMAFARAHGKDESVLWNRLEIDDMGVIAAYFNNFGVTDISALAVCPHLEELLFANNNTTDISVLANCGKLRKLCLANNGIEDISALASCTDLEFLSLGLNRVSDITVLAGCTRLRMLFLEDNPITDVSALASCTSLNELDLRGTDIRHISPLARCGSLSRLDLSGHLPADFSELAGSTHLRNLSLNDSRISDVSPLAGFRELEVLRLNARTTLPTSRYSRDSPYSSAYSLGRIHSLVGRLR